MSMLTPPGMGGKYRITGDVYPRMRRPHRRRRIVLASAAAVVVLGAAGWGTLQLVDVFSGDDTRKTTAGKQTDCKPAPTLTPSATAAAKPPKPAQVTVNVYNATPRKGLAKATADELKKRGFTIGKIGNASAAYDKKVPGTGILLGAPTATKGAFAVLGTQLTGATTKVDARTTADVDLIIGTAFKNLSPKATADAALVALDKPKPVPAARC
ncbi:LytR C-terminal domain-containing protein [Streptomyces sp. R302]|uniref:LytR C-terminal domain-containing protein n=1 Tax=unclassified Streptomyces TaxID=2593676 RepID=UPI00145EAF4D|nr:MULTISPECIES: LytR C-terminal domain-containing protein [unclassified Streptomyces]NML53975.1 LytR C-terminal domain-containing protein [Streptomyces sp. R301]NML83235.1 LytR C-terminal domain-containing protein [Streptomyces sp. R302]